jgi:hypothetical protein
LKSFGPTKLAGLEDAESIGEGDAETVSEDAKIGGAIVGEFRHRVIRVKHMARGSGGW